MPGATFQRLMDQIFGDFDFVYLYDFLISSGTQEEHCKHLGKVWDRLSKAGLAINLPKSEFCTSELEFLRHVVDASGHQTLSKHTTVVRDYPAPHLKEDISRFLGLLNFCQSFLPNAGLLLQPLTSLLKISADFVLEKDQQNSFQQAKRALLNTVTLQYPFPTTQIQPNTEASGTHIGAALMQQEKKEQPLFPSPSTARDLTQPRRNTQPLTENCWQPSYQSRNSDISWKAENSS